MAARIEQSYGETSAEAIEQLETRASISLPDRYKQFLLASNGGKAVPAEFAVPGWPGQSSAVKRFFGLHSGPHSNLEQNIEAYQDRLPPSFIPIADDPLGNLLVLGLAGATRGKVYFWDHEDELDDEGLSRMDMSNMFVVADSLGQLLDRLR